MIWHLQITFPAFVNFNTPSSKCDELLFQKFGKVIFVFSKISRNHTFCFKNERSVPHDVRNDVRMYSHNPVSRDRISFKGNGIWIKRLYVKMIVCNVVLSAFAVKRGVHSGQHPGIYPAPIAAVMFRMKTGLREVWNLVMFVSATGSISSAVQMFSGFRFIWFLILTFRLRPTAENRFRFDGQWVTWDVFRTKIGAFTISCPSHP